VYGLVLLGRWAVVTAVPADAFDCADLVSFFANTKPLRI